MSDYRPSLGNPATIDVAGGFTRVGRGPRYAMVHVAVDHEALNRVAIALHGIPGAMDRVIPPAMNKAALEARTWLYTEFLKRMNIARRASIKDRLEHRPKASKASWSTGIRIALTRFTVTSFKGARQRKAGVEWQPRAGKTRLIPRAFIRRGFTHYQTDKYVELRQAWRRAGGMGLRDKLVPRYPLFIMRGPSMARVFSDDPEFQDRAESQASIILNKKIGQRVDYEIQRRWPR
ncbi:MAG: hypothetical protein ABFE13_01535 [Phycisphaerales bacterium]